MGQPLIKAINLPKVRLKGWGSDQASYGNFNVTHRQSFLGPKMGKNGQTLLRNQKFGTLNFVPWLHLNKNSILN